ncbi:MAG: FKBP-type peptidyl-prolyl cis-trans isomerase [Bacteroidetes bacterium]|nr:FKBP-type peptidyl-prolyl cis-trans isomerase [Bacteroidota bacterium]
MRKVFLVATLFIFGFLFFSFKKEPKELFPGYKKYSQDTYVKQFAAGTGKILADTGGAVFVKVKFKTEKDSVFLDVNANAQASSFPILIKKPLFKGDFMDMFMHMHAGDSSCFFIQYDTLRKYYPNDFKFQQHVDSMKYIGFAVKVDSVFSRVMIDSLKAKGQREQAAKQAVQQKINQVMGQVQQQAKAKEPELKAKDKELLKPFLIQYGFNTPPDEDSIYFQTIKPGTGDALKLFTKVGVLYTGKFLDGTVFDSNTMVEGQQPLTFTLGIDPMILGFTKCIYKMHLGEKAIFVLPSGMAYKDGLTRVFEVEIISAQPSQH